MKLLNKLLLLLSSLSFGCSKTYYWYSHESTQRAPMYVFWSNMDGTHTTQLTDPKPLQLPDGTQYTAVFYNKKGGDSYLWPDKKLVKVECTPKEVVKRTKETMRLIRGR